jgi:nucleoside 2-deoxyribosyltransferase
MPNVYTIGSLRNPEVPVIAEDLRKLGFSVFDDWYSAGPHADDSWRDHERFKGHTVLDALDGAAARHVFAFDKKHLDLADCATLILPAGRSGHLELGYFVGTGKPGYILMEGEPERYDVMYRFAEKVFFTRVDMYAYMKVRFSAGLEGAYRLPTKEVI